VAWKPDYATLVEVKAYLRTADTLDDAELPGWITAASRAIDGKCNRQFGQEAAPVARTYRRAPFWDPTLCMWLLEVDDFMTSTAMTVAGVAVASAGVTLLPDNAPADGRPWTHLGYTTQPVLSYVGAPVSFVVSARWGWTAVPDQVKAAVKLQVSRWMARRDSPNGIVSSPDNGGLRVLARLDPDVATSLTRLSRRRRVG
jgi:hypothetical protein